jgi:histone H3/H4
MLMSSDSVETMNKLTGLFILYISSTAGDIAGEQGRKSRKIDTEHIYQALNELGFDNYVDTVKQTVAELKSKKRTSGLL